MQKAKGNRQGTILSTRWSWITRSSSPSVTNQQERFYSPALYSIRKDGHLVSWRKRLSIVFLVAVLTAGWVSAIMLLVENGRAVPGKAGARSGREPAGPWVCLDPGHSPAGPASAIDPESGLDVADCPGEPGELRANWDLAMELKPRLERAGYRVKVTKKSVDSCVDLKARAEIGNTCSMMVRLHCDVALKAVFYPVAGQFKAHDGRRVDVDHAVARDSARLARSLFRYLREVGVTRAMQEMGGHTNNTGTAYVVSALSRVPLILIENDPSILRDRVGRARVAQAILNGISAWFRAENR